MVVVVVLESLDDVAVCDGSGVTGVVLTSKTGAEEMLDVRPVKETGRWVVVAAVEAGA